MCKTKDINIAWIDAKKSTVGYEIPMTWYFYKYQETKAVDEILNRIIELEEVSSSLKKLFE